MSQARGYSSEQDGLGPTLKAHSQREETNNEATAIKQ